MFCELKANKCKIILIEIDIFVLFDSFMIYLFFLLMDFYHYSLLSQLSSLSFDIIFQVRILEINDLLVVSDQSITFQHPRQLLPLHFPILFTRSINFINNQTFKKLFKILYHSQFSKHFNFLLNLGQHTKKILS